MSRKLLTVYEHHIDQQIPCMIDSAEISFVTWGPLSLEEGIIDKREVVTLYLKNRSPFESNRVRTLIPRQEIINWLENA